MVEIYDYQTGTNPGDMPYDAAEQQDRPERFYVDAMHKDVPGVGRMVDYWRVVDGVTGMRADGSCKYDSADFAQRWCDFFNHGN